MVAPVFFSIQSLSYPGYNVTQRGTHLVLAATNIDNPFQLWYKDDSWNFLVDASGNPSFVLINHGSKKALKGLGRALTKVSVISYDPSVEDDTLLWSLSGAKLSQVALALNLTQSVKLTLGLGVGKQAPVSGDGIALIVSDRGDLSSGSQIWKFDTYVPQRYMIQVSWYTQRLTYKPPHQDVTYIAASSPKNDELTVVGVNSQNNTGDLQVWLRVPAGGQEDSNSSFIIINQGTGKALKGSTKPGDKVIAIEYDPLDSDFVWSEDRSVKSSQTYVAVNLSSSPNLQWYMPPDDEYQNSSYYHPLTVKSSQSPNMDVQRIWQFIPVTASTS